MAEPEREREREPEPEPEREREREPEPELELEREPEPEPELELEREPEPELELERYDLTTRNRRNSMNRQIIIVFVLLNIAVGGLLAAGIIGIGHHTLGEWIALELAQALGAMQVILYWSMRTIEKEAT